MSLAFHRRRRHNYLLQNTIRVENSTRSRDFPWAFKPRIRFQTTFMLRQSVDCIASGVPGNNSAGKQWNFYI